MPHIENGHFVFGKRAISIGEIARGTDPKNISESLKKVLKKIGVRLRWARERGSSRSFIASEWWRPLYRKIYQYKKTGRCVEQMETPLVPNKSWREEKIQEISSQRGISSEEAEILLDYEEEKLTN